MGANVAIELGRHPWLLSEGTEFVETLHRFDLPLIGVIRHGNALHLFRCIKGEVDSAQAWAYTPITQEGLETVRAAGPGDLDDVLDRVGQGKPTVFALADEERGLTVSALLGDLSGYPSPLYAARAALRDALDEIDARLGRSVA